jgi:hypothetical protein
MDETYNHPPKPEGIDAPRETRGDTKPPAPVIIYDARDRLLTLLCWGLGFLLVELFAAPVVLPGLDTIYLAEQSPISAVALAKLPGSYADEAMWIVQGRAKAACADWRSWSLDDYLALRTIVS